MRHRILVAPVASGRAGYRASCCCGHRCTVSTRPRAVLLGSAHLFLNLNGVKE